MDISPGDSTPTSETSYSRTPTSVAAGVSDHHHHHHHHHPHPSSSSSAAVAGGSGSAMLHTSALPRLASHPPTCSGGNLSTSSNISTPQRQSCFQSSKPPLTPNLVPTQQQQQQQASPSSVSTPSNNPTSSGPSMSLASLPRLLSQITGNKGLDQSQLSPQKALQTIQTAILLSQQVSLEPGGSGGANYDGAGTANSNSTGNHQINSMQSSSQMQPLKVDTSNNATLGEGPPTPTHSESQDYVDARKGKNIVIVPMHLILILY